MQKWEYSVMEARTTDIVNLQEMLALQGEQGWELVSATSRTDRKDGEMFTLFLKRPETD